METGTGPDFFSTDAGQFASAAKQFLEGARVLDEAPLSPIRLLFRPTLHLAGHGLELMLKACVYLNDSKPSTSGSQGHNIDHLWSLPICEPVRGHVRINAHLAVQEDRSNPRYRGIPAIADVDQLIDEHVKALCDLHGPGSGYPLRYPADPDAKGPNTPLLVKSLWRTADDLVKRPNDFRLDRFLKFIADSLNPDSQR